MSTGIYALASAAILLMVVAAFAAARKAQDTKIAFWAVMFVTLLPNMTTLVAAFTGGRVVSVDIYYNRVVTYVGLSAKVNVYASIVLTAALLALVLFQISHGIVIRWSVVAFGCIVGVTALISSQGIPGAQVALGVAVLAACVLPGGMAAAAGAGISITALAGLSLLATALNADLTSTPCDDRKCGVTGVLFSGIADNQNSFGLLMALGVPFVYLGLRRFNMVLTIAVVFLTWASGDRTAQIASLFGFVAVFIVDRANHSRTAKAILPASVVLLATSIIAPFASLDSAWLTGRPYYWQLALDRLRSDWMIGFGTDGWRRLVDTGEIERNAGYSTHNQFLEAAFLAGALGVILLTLVYVGIATEAPEKRLAAAVAVPILICAITERPWSIDRIDWMSWSLVAFALFAIPKVSAPVDSVVELEPRNSANDQHEPARGSNGVRLRQTNLRNTHRPTRSRRLSSP